MPGPSDFESFPSGLGGRDPGAWHPQRVPGDKYMQDPNGYEARARRAGVGAFGQGQQYTTMEPDAGALGAQEGALDAIGQRAFGGPQHGAAQGQEAAMTSPYHQQSLVNNGAQGLSMGQALSTEGQAQLRGLGQAQGMSDTSEQQRLSAISDYGQQAGAIRGQQGQLAQFNATQQGELVRQIYNLLAQQAMSGQQRQDAKDASTNQMIAQTGLSIAKGFSGAVGG